MTYPELRQALKVLGLPERASLKEIKAKHRGLVKRHHPDQNPNQGTDRIRDINAAYRLLMDYCSSYRFSFSEKEFYEQNPEEQLRKQFSQDPWGG